MLDWNRGTAGPTGAEASERYAAGAFSVAALFLSPDEVIRSCPAPAFGRLEESGRPHGSCAAMEPSHLKEIPQPVLGREWSSPLALVREARRHWVRATHGELTRGEGFPNLAMWAGLATTVGEMPRRRVELAQEGGVGRDSLALKWSRRGGCGNTAPGPRGRVARKAIPSQQTRERSRTRTTPGHGRVATKRIAGSPWA